MLKKITNIPGTWYALFVVVFQIVFITTGGNSDSFVMPFGALFLRPLVPYVYLGLIYYWLIHCLKSFYKVPFYISTITFLVLQGLLFLADINGFHYRLWHDINLMLILTVVSIAIIASIYHFKRVQLVILFFIMFIVGSAYFKSYRQLYQVMFTSKKLWGDVNISIKTKDGEEKKMIIPKRYFQYGIPSFSDYWGDGGFYMLEVHEKDMSPFFTNTWDYRRNHDKAFSILLFGDSSKRHNFYRQQGAYLTNMGDFSYKYWLDGKNLDQKSRIEGRINRLLSSFMLPKTQH